MASAVKSGIFPPVTLSFIEEKIFSVQIDPSAEVQQELDRYILEDGLNLSYQTRYALTLYRESFMTREDHAKDNIAWYMRNMDSPGSKPLSMDERNAIAHGLGQEMSQLMAQGDLGNLLLPQEVYEFVKQKIDSAEFASPTEVLTAAMPFLRAQRGTSPRAEFLTENRYVLFG